MWLCVSEARSRLVRQRRSVMRDTVQFGGGAGMVVPLAPSSGEQCSMMLPSMWLCLPVETLVPGYWMWNTGRMCMSHPIFALQHPRINQLSWFRRGQIYEREREREGETKTSTSLLHSPMHVRQICKLQLCCRLDLFASHLFCKLDLFTNHHCPAGLADSQITVVLQIGPVVFTNQLCCRLDLFTNHCSPAGLACSQIPGVLQAFGLIHKSLLSC